MKTSQFAALRYGCVALAAILLLLLAAWNAPHRATAADLGCQGTEERHGSDEAPERCSLDNDCKGLPDNCSKDYMGTWYKYTDFMYVGDCELASCPQTARCVYCNGIIVCASFKSYSSKSDCLSDYNGMTGYSMKNNRCTGTEGG